MKILVYSHLFYPSVGGIETIAEQLTENFVKLGHKCTLVTAVSLNEKSELYSNYKIIRCPTNLEKIKLIKSHDIVYSNGASLKLFWWAYILGKPFVWTHQGYQLSSIDGLGWVDGVRAPLTPFASYKFHIKKSGLLSASLGYAKLIVRRVAGNLVSKNVAVTSWVASRQPLPSQIVLHTPYSISSFSAVRQNKNYEYDFFYLGRLVSEKGVSTLLRAFHHLLAIDKEYQGNLLLIGDGTWRSHLEEEARTLGIFDRIDFVGKKTGSDLLEWVSKGRIAVIPSEWEEPMGGVSVELLAAGKPIIVSRKGGLAECVGDAGLIFENGDYLDLASQMQKLLNEKHLCESLREKALKQLEKFDEKMLAQNYINLFESLLKKKL